MVLASKPPSASQALGALPWLCQWCVNSDGCSAFVHCVSRAFEWQILPPFPRFLEKIRAGRDLSQIFAMEDRAGRRAGIEAAIAALERGALVAMPTETVYGLAADATSPAAVAGIFAAKARPRFNPLIVHVESAETAERVAVFHEPARHLAAAFWPGPLTLVLPLRQGAKIADLVTTDLDTVRPIRVPGRPVAQELLRATIAHSSPPQTPTAPATSSPDHRRSRGGRSRRRRSAPSFSMQGRLPLVSLRTIISFDAEVPVLLRPSGLDRHAIEARARPGAHISRRR